MSLIHDAYLFRPEEFTKAIAPLVQTTEPGSSRRIVNYVLELFDHSDSVRALAPHRAKAASSLPFVYRIT